jgi:hypothetical protein
MIIDIFDAKTHDQLFSTDNVEDFNIYRAGDDWVISVVFYDDEAEDDITHEEILTRADSLEASDDLIMIKRSYEQICIFSSEVNSKAIIDKLFSEDHKSIII